MAYEDLLDFNLGEPDGRTMLHLRNEYEIHGKDATWYMWYRLMPLTEAREE